MDGMRWSDDASGLGGIFQKTLQKGVDIMDPSLATSARAQQFTPNTLINRYIT